MSAGLFDSNNTDTANDNALVEISSGDNTGNKANVNSSKEVLVKDTTADTSLASIDTKLTSQATAANQTSANTKLDTLHTDFGVVEGKQDTGNTSLASIDTKASTTNTNLATLHTDFGIVEGKQDTGNTSLASIDTKLTSQATAANQATELTRLGDVTETAPATDTASSGLNGRMQRIAQRLTSLIGVASTELTLAALSAKFGSLGQKLMSGSAPVVLASDQTPIPVFNPLDTTSSTINITTQDLVSSTATGFANQSLITGTPTVGSVAAYTLASIQTVMVLVSGTWTGTLSMEVSEDGGTTWEPRGIHIIGTSTFAAAVTANVAGSMNGAGKTNVRVRATTAMTGTASVKIVVSDNPSNVYIANSIKLVDGSSTPNVNTLAIKAASVAPATTDTAAVVGIRPDSTMQTAQDKSGTGNITSGSGAGNTVVATTNGASTLVLNITGTWVATLLFEGQDGNGLWIPALASIAGQGGAESATGTNNQFILPCGGFNQVRVRASVYASGTAIVNWNAGAGTNSLQVFNLTPSGLQATVTGSGVAGTPSSGVVSIQGVAGGTVVPANVTQIVTASDKTGSGTIVALNGTVAATTNGCSIISFNVTGTWVATIVVEGTLDGGTTWLPIDADVDATDTIINSFTVNGLVTVNCASYGQVRLRASLYTSGTLSASWEAGAGLSLVQVYNTNAASFRVTVVPPVLTPAAPTATAVGVASASALASNASRRGLVMTNTSANKISLNIVGGAAVLNSGITLYPGGTWYMDEFTYTTAAIFAIASAASSNLAIQELS